MQVNKSTKKIEQIEKVSDTSEKIVRSISEIMDKFEIRPILKPLDILKRCGFLISSIAFALVVLPFLGVESVAAMFKPGLNESDLGKKDVYYDAKNNPHINWRNLLLMIAKRFKYLVSRDTNELCKIKEELRQYTALIFDDTALEKTGKAIEGIGYIHDHVTDRHILGYKLLVCGFWDGISFIPIDFSLHKEPGGSELKKAEKRFRKQNERIQKKEVQINTLKQAQQAKIKLLSQAECEYQHKSNKTNNKKLIACQKAVDKKNEQLQQNINALTDLETKAQELENEYLEIKSNYRYCGLSKKDKHNQYDKQRDQKSHGAKRKKETGDSKIDATIKMIKRAIKHGFIPDFVLTDSWFFSQKLLKAVIEIGRAVNLVSMASIGNAKYKILPEGKFLNPHQIISLYEREQGKTSRKHNARYIQLQANYQGFRVQIFLIRFGNTNNWRLLVTTDLRMSFVKIMEVYKIRWTIEVFFRECKQHLLLGKCQSQDFDAQIADTTLTMIRYILLSYYERIHYGMTLGGLFSKISQMSVKENLLADINLYFTELLKLLANRAGIDFLEFYEDLLRTPEAAPIMYSLGMNINKKAA